MVVVAESGSITGLQQQIKAAFGRWRKRGQSSSGGRNSDDNRSVQSVPGRLDHDTFDSHTIRLSSQSQTFSHPHRTTVFPPFPSGTCATNGTSGSSSGASTTAATFSSSCGGGPSSSSAHCPPPSSSSSVSRVASSTARALNPLALVRALRRKAAAGSGTHHHHHHHHHHNRESAERERWPSPAAPSSKCAAELSAYPLGCKSHSDHNLHSIIKDDNTWTVFATLQPPAGHARHFYSIF